MSDRVFLPEQMFEHLDATHRAEILKFSDNELRDFLIVPILAPRVREFAEAEQSRRLRERQTTAQEFSARANAHTSGNTGVSAAHVQRPFFRTSAFWYWVIGLMVAFAIAWWQIATSGEVSPQTRTEPMTTPTLPTPPPASRPATKTPDA